MNDHTHNHSQDVGNISTFIVGAAVGAALTYLLGTKDGQKIKNQLIKEGQKLLEEMAQGLDGVKDKVKDTELGRSAEEGEVGKKLEAVAEKIDDVKQQLEGIAEDVPEHIAQLQKKGRRFFFKRSASRSES